MTTFSSAPQTADLGGGRLAALCGIASVALLAASILWAHHWGPRADTIVSAWTLATLAALFLGWRAMGSNRAARRRGGWGVGLGLVSVAALVLAGILYAAGISLAGVCGGG